MLDVLISDKPVANEKLDILEENCKILMKEEKLSEEVETMCNLGQGIYERGLNQGEKRKAIKDAKKLLRLGKVTVEEIAMCTDLSVDEVKKLESEMYCTA